MVDPDPDKSQGRWCGLFHERLEGCIQAGDLVVEIAYSAGHAAHRELRALMVIIEAPRVSAKTGASLHLCAGAQPDELNSELFRR